MAIVELIWQRQQDALARGALNVWTVYDHPADFPAGYVARRFETGGGRPEPLATGDAFTGDLVAIRAAFERCGLYRMPRQESDEPQIVESWL